MVQCQAQMNKLIKSMAPNIPEHVLYTALPQLISRVVHTNGDTSKNVRLMIRSVLAKYPRQAMWSCGWLRYSKSEDKKKAGDVSISSLNKPHWLSSSSSPPNHVSFVIRISSSVLRGC